MSNQIQTRIGIIVSQFNAIITEKLCDGAVSRLTQAGLTSDNLSIITVPGAIEIPLIAKILAKSRKYQAIICLGCVIRGQTTHYDYVCQQVSHGCQKVMLKFSIPVIFGVLTTENLAQAKARVGGKYGHKGIEAAETALQMIKIIQTI